MSKKPANLQVFFRPAFSGYYLPEQKIKVIYRHKKWRQQRHFSKLQITYYA